ncbi:MAG: hypothetical protein CMJ81_19390 [Planctomycetaceae bacterium]|nr:hypothetical protein [Planctomycetaceae bacterium]
MILIQSLANLRHIRRSISHTITRDAAIAIICLLVLVCLSSAQELPTQEEDSYAFQTKDGKYSTIGTLAGFMLDKKFVKTVKIWQNDLQVVLLKEDGTATKSIPVNILNEESQARLQSLNQARHRRETALLYKPAANASVEEMLKDLETLLCKRWDRSQLAPQDPFDSPAISRQEAEHTKDRGLMKEVEALRRRTAVIEKYIENKTNTSRESPNSDKLRSMIQQFEVDMRTLSSLSQDELLSGPLNSEIEQLFHRYPMATVIGNNKAVKGITTRFIAYRDQYVYHVRPYNLTKLALEGARYSLGPCAWLGSEVVLETPKFKKYVVQGIYNYYLMS